MSKHVYFVRDCPTCGRRLHIRVEYLGKKVVCPHCGSGLDAVDLAAGGPSVAETSPSLMQRVDELLEDTSDETIDFARLPHPR